MARGFVYLTAVLDWFSRRVVSWRVSITLEVDFCLDAVEGHRQLGCRPACEMRLSRVGGRDDDIYLSELCRLPLPG